MNTIFNDWTREKLELAFGVYQIDEHPLLQEWLDQREPLTEFEQQCADFFRHIARRHIDFWKKQDLIAKFAGPITTLANFETERFTSFADIHLEATVGENQIVGTADLLIATGREEHRQPLFAVLQFIQNLHSGDDPAGQCLAAMMTAQSINNQHNMELPVYGCYVVRQSWFFMVLHDYRYAVSDAYVATRNDITDIIGILKRLRSMINSSVNS